MLTKRSFLAAAASLAALLTLTACSSSPESTVEDFFSALDSGKIEKAVDYYSPQVRQVFGTAKVTAAAEQGARDFAKRGHLEKVVVEVVRPGDERVRVKALLLFKDGSKRSQDLTVVKVEGKWYLGE